MLLTTLIFGQAAVTADWTSVFASVGALPLSVTVSPLRSNLKSATPTAAPRIDPRVAKSGALTPGLTLVLSVTSMPEPKANLRLSDNDALASWFGSSPPSVKPSPVCAMDSGAKFISGAVAFDAVVSSLLLPGAVSVAEGFTPGAAASKSVSGGLCSAHPIAASSSGIASNATSQAAPGG